METGFENEIMGANSPIPKPDNSGTALAVALCVALIVIGIVYTVITGHF